MFRCLDCKIKGLPCIYNTIVKVESVLPVNVSSLYVLHHVHIYLYNLKFPRGCKNSSTFRYILFDT